MSTNKEHNAGAFKMQNGEATEISFPIPWAMVYDDALKIIMDDHDLSHSRKIDHEKAIIRLSKKYQDNLPYALTDEQESRLIDFLAENF